MDAAQCRPHKNSQTASNIGKCERSGGDLHELQRVLLFHFPAMLDKNEFWIDFLTLSKSAKEEYID